MLISLTTCVIITSILELSKGAPKLSNTIYFDPLSIENSILNYLNLKNHRNPDAINKRRNANDLPETPTKPCHGYDFDETKCKIVSNRILCGYNKNRDEIKPSDEFVNMGNDCRMRNDRIECGYVGNEVSIDFDKTKVKVKKTNVSSKEHIVKKLFGNIETNTSTEPITEPQPLTKKYKDISSSNNIGRSSKEVESPASTIIKDKDTEDTVSSTPNDEESEEFLENDNVAPSFTTITTNETLTNYSLNTINIETSTSTTIKSNSTTKHRESVEHLQIDNSTKIARNDKNSSVTKIERPLGLCVEKDDRIVCYDTAMFRLFKKNRMLL